MGAGNDNVTLFAAIAAAGSLKMGECDDTVTVNEIQTTKTAGAIDGVAGDNDKLVFTDTTFVADAAHHAAFTGFEVLEVSNATAATPKDFDISLIADIKNYAESIPAGSVTISNIINNTIINVTGNIADTKELTVKLGGDTQNDTHIVCLITSPMLRMPVLILIVIIAD